MARCLFLRRRLSLLSILVLLAAVPAGADDDWLNIRLNQDATSQLQNEQQIVLNPTDPTNMVAVWRDFRLGYRQVGWAYTFDDGLTWTEGGLFNEPSYPWQSDPALTVDTEGNFYAVLLSYTSTSQPNGFFMFKSTDGGVSWEEPTVVVDGVPDVFEDKEYVACDRTGGAHHGNFYVAWARFGWTVDVVFRRSTDGGVNWGSTVAVSDQSGIQFPIPVVGKNGDVYVAWCDYGSSQIKFDISTNGGASFGTDRVVTNVSAVFTVLNGGVDAYGSPHMDADITDGPYAGRLYMAFMDQRFPYDSYDIFVIYSDDGGVNWSTPSRINDDMWNNQRDQFLPWLTVDNAGVVTVVWLDRRHDPANLTYHCFLAQSHDGGATWSPNVQVSTEPSNPNDAFRAVGIDSWSGESDGPANKISLSRAGLLGEYIGVASWNGHATPVWTDIRNLHQDTYAGYDPIKTGVETVESAPTALKLFVAPNPVRIGAAAMVRGNADGPSSVSIYDPSGRLVRTERIDRTGGLFQWDGSGADGRPVGPGVYFLRLRTAEGSASGKIVIVR